MIGKERIEEQIKNADNYTWLKTPREIEVYKMGLSDAYNLIKHEQGKGSIREREE